MDIGGYQNKSKQPNRDWFDWWLGDERPSPSARQELRRRRVEQANTYKSRRLAAVPAQTAPAEEINTVVINLSLPKLTDITPKNTVSYVRRHRLVSGAAALLLVLLAIGLLPQKTPAPQAPAAQASTASKSTQSAQVAKGTPATQAPASSQTNDSASQPAVLSDSTAAGPSFTPVVPLDEPGLAKLTPVRTAYNADAGIYTIMDSFMGTPLTINETLITPTYSSPQQALLQETAKIGASQPIELTTGKAYMQPVSPKSQTVVMVSRGVLIFVNSFVSHSADEWKTYLTKLN